MSRRDPTPKRESSVEGLVEVSVVCSGRGNHPEVSFGHVALLRRPDRLNLHGLKVEEFVGGMDEKEHRLRRTVPFLCRRCTPARNVPLQVGTMTTLCVGLVDAGATRLDLSALGAIGPISS